MLWYELYDNNTIPTNEDIEKFINNPLWEKMNTFIEENYGVDPLLSYSGCAAQTGWNMKYKKSGKSLCVLYPMEGYFIALVTIGNKELTETELRMPFCTKYLQELYKNTPFSCGGKWLMINVTDKDILEDLMNLIQIRVRPKK